MSSDNPEWADFILHDFSFVAFAPGSRVLDVGCGDSEQLENLRRAGHDPVGVEPSPTRVYALVARGFRAIRGVAEDLLRTMSGETDGVPPVHGVIKP